jgi:two-component system response regulator HydG
MNNRVIATESPVDRHSPPPGTGNPAVSTQATICVVDDDNSILISLKRLLEGEGYSVRTFASADESLEYVERNAVPLAILDIWMEGMTGMELMAHLCARSPRTHTIFVTGHEDRAAEATVMQAGAFAFFIKPFEPSKFLVAVQNAVVDSLRLSLPTEAVN